MTLAWNACEMLVIHARNACEIFVTLTWNACETRLEKATNRA